MRKYFHGILVRVVIDTNAAAYLFAFTVFLFHYSILSNYEYVEKRILKKKRKKAPQLHCSLLASKVKDHRSRDSAP